MNLTKSQLLNHLEQFIGTEYYYPLWPNIMLNWTCGDVLRSNRPHLAAGQLARR
jgi:hypothetical protein